MAETQLLKHFIDTDPAQHDTVAAQLDAEGVQYEAYAMLPGIFTFECTPETAQRLRDQYGLRVFADFKIKMVV